jgi:hypothetical protein
VNVASGAPTTLSVTNPASIVRFNPVSFIVILLFRCSDWFGG